MSVVTRGIVAILVLLQIGTARAEELFNLPTRPGVTQPIYATTTAAPAATLLLFPGGIGVVSRVRNNFLIRTVPKFVALGMKVAVVDAPSDQSSGLSDAFHISADRATDVATVIAFMRQRAAVPVWLVGTSRGTLSAGALAARLGPSQIAGVVLTSSVWRGGMPLVSLDQISVPTLVVHNRDDGCKVSPFSDAAFGFGRLQRASVKELIAVSGGTARSAPCEALSTHGYYGIEDEVVGLIVAWVKAH